MSVLRSVTGVALLLLLPAISPVQAQMLSIWAEEEMQTCVVTRSAPYLAFDVYIVLSPGNDGAVGIEYKLRTLPGHFAIESTPASFITETFTGTPFGAPGVSASFDSCQTSIVWVWKFTCMSPNAEPGYYIPEPHDDTGLFGVYTCQAGNPFADAIAYNYFGFNDWAGCTSATKESSWGAIKEMYR